MTSRSYFGKMNSTLGSVVPLAMFKYIRPSLHAACTYQYLQHESTHSHTQQNNKINIFGEHYICWLNAIDDSNSLLVVSNEIPLTHFQLLLNSTVPKNVARPSSHSSSSSSLPSVYYLSYQNQSYP